MLPGQGYYHNPTFIFKGPDGGDERTVPGYVTDIITDMSPGLAEGARSATSPSACSTTTRRRTGRGSPTRSTPHMYLNEDVPEPDTLYDDYANRATAAEAAAMRVGVHMNAHGPQVRDPRRHCPKTELRKWAYQRYIKDYLRVVASVDDNVGRVLDYLDERAWPRTRS